MTRVRRILAAAIGAAAGVVVLAATVLRHEYWERGGAVLLHWAMIVAVSAVLLGIVNVVAVHIGKWRRREDGWIYSGVLLIAFFTVLVPGLIGGAEAPLVHWVFHNVAIPIQAALFSLSAFYLFTATCRAAKIRDLETAVFWSVCVVVLLGQAPLSRRLWAQLPAVAEWVLTVPVTAGARGLMFGVALGTVATGLRLLCGIDRPYEGEEEYKRGEIDA